MGDRTHRAPATAISFDVTGTDSEGLLRLQAVAASVRINGQACGFGFGRYPVTPPPSVTSSVGIPRRTPSTAQESWTVFTYGDTATWTVHYQVDLTCTGCGGVLGHLRCHDFDVGPEFADRVTADSLPGGWC